LTNAFSPFNSETSRKEKGSAGQPRFANRLILALATWGGVGYLPGAPGTWATVAALPLWWLLAHLGPLGYALAVAVLLAVAVSVAGPAQVLLERVDHPAIVIVGFVAFRAFDILKPWPLSWLNRGTSGLAVVLDDVAAGVLARLVLAVVQVLIGGGG
jgi:phosphatidylglycerophosphatase A